MIRPCRTPQPAISSRDVGRATPPPGHSCSMYILLFTGVLTRRISIFRASFKKNSPHLFGGRFHDNPARSQQKNAKLNARLTITIAAQAPHPET